MTPFPSSASKKHLHFVSYLTLILLCVFQSYYTQSIFSCMDGTGQQVVPSLEDYSFRPGSSRKHRTITLNDARYDYCVIQITSKQGAVDRADANFRIPSPEFSQFHVYVNKYDRIVGSLNLDALESAFLEHQACSLEHTKWVFLGDDDTLFYDKGIQTFMRQRSIQESKLYAHGNFFNPRKPYDKSWYNGGSGIAFTGEVVRLLLQNTTQNNNALSDIIQREYQDCSCGDVPFARVLQYFRVRTIHQPNLFLDSCLDCNGMEVEGLDIVACHGATLFRDINPQANDKSLHMKDLHSNYFSETQLKNYGEYKQPGFFANMTLLDRRRYFDQICTTI
jgi:hypothetical protein